MILSVVLALLGAGAGFAAVLILVARYGGAAETKTLELARLGSVRLQELERAAQDAASAHDARVAVLHELLEAARTDASQWWPIRGDRGALATIGLAMLAVACFSLLPMIDRAPQAAPAALATAISAQDADLARLELFARAKPARAPETALTSKPQQELPDVETMIGRLAARLETTPADVDGWRMLGWSYLHTQQPAKAAQAFAQAVALEPKSPELKSAYGEALVAAEGGTVTAQAVETFKAALALDATDAKARYFVALALEQAGKKKEALEAWIGLHRERLGDEPWVSELRERTRLLAAELEVDVSERVAPPARAGGERNAANQQ